MGEGRCYQAGDVPDSNRRLAFLPRRDAAIQGRDPGWEPLPVPPGATAGGADHNLESLEVVVKHGQAVPVGVCRPTVMRGIR